MIDSAAAGDSANYMDMMRLHKVRINFCGGVLILAYYNGVVILPEQQIWPVLPNLQNGFLKGQVVGRVLAVSLQIYGGLGGRHYVFLLVVIDFSGAGPAPASAFKMRSLEMRG